MIEIESLDHNFKGIGKNNGKIVFVKNALPKELVEIKITKDKKHFSEAEVVNFIKKSKKRIQPKCKCFGFCGGCDLMHINYPEQLKYKEEKIKNIIEKYLQKSIKINKIIYDTDSQYRNKIKFQIDKKVGFYKNNTHEIISVNDCKIADKKINDCIPYLNKLNLKNIESIVCRTAQNKLMINIQTKNNLNIDISCLKDIANSIFINNKHIYGDKNLVENLDGYNYYISPNSFFQINKKMCIKLYKKIKEYVGEHKKVLDLYCGCGSIGIFINNNNEVLGIEINKDAVKDANENKKINNLKNINFICGDSSIESNFNPDIIIVDPPRNGLNDKTINKINNLKPKKLIYVSCNPLTLVRDLNKLNLFDIVELTPFDMFPNTKHIECICLLSQKNKI